MNSAFWVTKTTTTVSEWFRFL